MQTFKGSDFKQKVHAHWFRVTKMVEGVSIRDVINKEKGEIVEVIDTGCARDIEKNVKVETIQEPKDILE